MMWSPDSVSMIPDISLIFSPNAASSKGFCIMPRLNLPRSPPFLYDEQSEYLVASSVNSAVPSSIFLR